MQAVILQSESQKPTIKTPNPAISALLDTK
jgi:hypothetical protein